MNLMNLPPPFGAVISDPGAVVRVTEGERKSESEAGESEIGSDGEGRRPERSLPMSLPALNHSVFSHSPQP